MGRCDPGLRTTREMEVTAGDTAEEVGSGDVPVVATPRLLALAECACVDAIAGELAEGETTVSAWAEIEHLRATLVGGVIHARATLIGHHGRRLEFTVLLEQDGEPVARVNHRRMLVDRARFMDKLATARSA